MAKIAVITGTTSGIGKALSEKMAKAGYEVYGLQRRITGRNDISEISVDVSDYDQVKKAIDEIYEKTSRIDICICNAGYGISGPLEEAEISDIRRQMDVNFYGFLYVAKAVLPYMREQREGKILVTSSVAGVVSIPFQAMYSVSKAAINSLVAALANEVRDFNINVSAIMPGDVSTGFTDARVKGNLTENSEYRKKSDKSVATMEKDERNGMTCEFVAGYIMRIAGKKNPKILYTVGFMYKLITVLIKLLPCRFANWVVGKIYAS